MPPAPATIGIPRYAGGCHQPVLLRGRVDHIDCSTGELLHRYTTVHEPGGVLAIACKSRRASRCPPCAQTYRADTYQVIRTGLTGGKGIPASVASHPCVFTTLTAPSFGPVHARREKDGNVLRCRPRRRGGTCPHGRPLSCGEKHDPDDARLGEPLCPDCYDYTGAVLFNALAPDLWRRFTIALRRALARQAGLTNTAFAAQVRVSYAKVAEYQRRGVVHYHAIIRLDGPGGPATRPPAWATLALLTAAIGQAARTVHLQAPAAAGLPPRTIAWGRELDIRPVTTSGEVTDAKVAAYLAKYATKAAECTGTINRRITPADQLDALPIREHARRHIAECIRLSHLPELEHLRLAAWAHMLGFRATSLPRAAPTRSPWPACEPTAPPTSKSTPKPPDSSPTLTPAPRSSSIIGTSPGAITESLRICLPRPAGQADHLRRQREVSHARLLLTVPEAAEALAISRSKLYELLASGAIASIRIDGSRRIPLAALEAYVSGLLAERTVA